MTFVLKYRIIILFDVLVTVSILTMYGSTHRVQSLDCTIITLHTIIKPKPIFGIKSRNMDQRHLLASLLTIQNSYIYIM